MDINNVNLIGRLTKDIELKYATITKADGTVETVAGTMFTLAVGNGKDKEGTNKPADFISINAWRKTAENLAKYCKKGSQIAVEGRLKADSYEDKEGNKKYRTYVKANQIEFIGTKRETEPLPTPGEEVLNEVASNINNQPDPFQDFGEEITLNDDDLPF